MARTEKKRFLLRVDGDLFDALEKWAAHELRSVNGQIEYLLHDAVRRSGRSTAPTSDKKEQREVRKKT